MSASDPIADLLTRIRNAQAVGKTSVSMMSSKMKIAILKLMKEEGYIEDYLVTEQNKKPEVQVGLKYHADRPVIEYLKRVSRPGLRVYKSKDQLPKVMDGLGVAVISTPQGVMTDRRAREKGFGGEVICYVA